MQLSTTSAQIPCALAEQALRADLSNKRHLPYWVRQARNDWNELAWVERLPRTSWLSTLTPSKRTDQL